MNFLNPDHNWKSEQLPSDVQQEVDEFCSGRNASPMTVYKLERGRWMLHYAINRYTNKHAEYNYNLITVTA